MNKKCVTNAMVCTFRKLFLFVNIETLIYHLSIFHAPLNRPCLLLLIQPIIVIISSLWGGDMPINVIGYKITPYLLASVSVCKYPYYRIFHHNE